MAAEKRLIDADALGRFSFHIECEEDGETFERCVVDWDDIEDAPTVDAVEVVPCKECKHRGHILRCPMCFEEQYEFDEGDGYMCTDYRTYDRTKDNGYCDRGERKDNE